MLHSMTGYGKAEAIVAERIIIVEIKSLNGKQFDLRMLVPSFLKPFEINIRKHINQHLERASVECTKNIKTKGNSKPVTINTDLLKAYYTSSYDVAKELGASTDSLLANILRLPDVVSNSYDTLPEEEWHLVEKIFIQALENLNKHRLTEGSELKKDFLNRLDAIENYHTQIAELAPLRRIKIKEGIQKLLEENVGKENYDSNRLEQELIYYIEKIDVSEEQVRLTHHCQYFKTILQNTEKSKGKKLSFILQEFGREINTTGSKAYDAQIQQWVVLMKDELEKMKEQVLNVL